MTHTTSTRRILERVGAMSKSTVWTSAAAVLLVASVVLAPVAVAEELQWTYEPAFGATPPADPPLPPTSVFPIQMVLDDDVAEGSFGVLDSATTSRQFLWFNRFDPPGPTFDLEEIWVLFQPETTGTVAPGAAIQLAVFSDADGDPSNGPTTFFSVRNETVQTVDGTTFSIYPVDPPVRIPAGEDVWIGVVSRFVTTGVTPPVTPAALDTTNPQGGSWIAVWSADPPDPPDFAVPPDDELRPVDDFQPGNFMIRGFGTSVETVAIPTLDTVGLVALGAVLAIASLFLLRRRGAALAVVFCALALASPAAGQVLIDDFSVPQAIIEDPGASDNSVAAGGIGGERDMIVRRASGTGTVSALVAGGSLIFTAPGAPTATTGSLELQYDGADGDAEDFDPVGLGGLDLTTGGASAIRLQSSGATAGAQVTVEVWTSATAASGASLVLPAVAGATDLFIDFAEFEQLPGATGAADFANVGGIRIVIRGTSVGVTMTELRTVPPNVSADKVDFDSGGTPIAGSVTPGQTLRYRITIQNPGGGATATDIADMISAELGLTANSVRSTPIARNDQYTSFGGVQLAPAAAQGLLANDSDADMDAVAAVPAVAQATAQGGTVDIAADGSFTYNPPAGFSGVDSFTYTLAAVAGDPTADSSGAAIGAITGSATINLARSVWFVDNSQPTVNSLGTQGDPFHTLAEAETASGPGDIIRLRQGDGTTLGHTAGILLKSGQQIIGGGVDLVIDGQVIEAADAGRPIITHTGGGHGINLAETHEIHGVDIESTNGTAILGSSVGDVTISEVSITDAGAEAIHIDGGNLDFTLDRVDSLNSTQHGVRLNNVTGTLTATTTEITETTEHGIQITNSPGFTASFGATTIVGAGDDGTRGMLVITVGHGIDLATNAGATITFASLSVDSDTGTGIRSTNGGTVDIQSTTGTVNADSGPALDVDNTDLATGMVTGWTFASLASASSDTHGVRLANLDDPVSVTGTTTVMNHDTTGILVQSSGGVAFDFGAASVTDTFIGGAHNGNGIDVGTGNAGASFTFDSLNVVTDGGFGLLANNSGTINVGGAGNVVNATGGAALDLTSTTIGGTATFATLSSAGSAAQGINLVNLAGAIVGNAGSIGTAAGTAVNVDGGGPTFTYGGSVTQNVAQRVVNVEDTTAGAVTFQTGTVTGGASSLGVRIHNADGNVSFADLDLGTSGAPMTNVGVTLTGGSTGTMSFAGTQIFTTGAVGIDGNNGGVVQATGTGNRVSATNATAVDFRSGTTIGASHFTLERLDSSGAARGLRLDSTGATGRFEVTGDGASDPANTTRGRTTAAMGGGTLTLGSGGTIENSTGPGVLLNNTQGGVVLRNMTIMDVTNAVNDGSDGIDIASSTGLTLDNVRITGHGGNHGLDASSVADVVMMHTEIFANATTAGTEGPDIHNVRFDNLSGTSSATHSLFNTSRENIFSIFNTTGTLGFTMTNSEVRDTTAAAPGNVGLLFDLTSTAVVNATVEDSTFLRNRARAIQYLSNSGSTNGSFTADNNAIESSFVGIDVAHQSAGQTVAFDVLNNDINMDAGVMGESNAINIVLGGVSASTTTLSGTISGNNVGLAGSSGSGSFEGVGILAHAQGAGTLTTHVYGNTVRAIRLDSAFVALSTDHTGEMNLTLGDAASTTGNVFDVTPGAFPLYGIDLTAGASAGDSGTLRVNFEHPSTATGDVFAKGIQLLMVTGSSTIELQGYGGADCTSAGGAPCAAVAAFVDGANIVSPSPTDVFVFGGSNTITGTVSAPGGVVPKP